MTTTESHPSWCADPSEHKTDTCESVHYPAGEGVVWLDNDCAELVEVPQVNWQPSQALLHGSADVRAAAGQLVWLSMVPSGARLVGRRLIELADLAERASDPEADRRVAVNEQIFQALRDEPADTLRAVHDTVTSMMLADDEQDAASG